MYEKNFYFIHLLFLKNIFYYFIASFEKGFKRLEKYLKTLDYGNTTPKEGGITDYDEDVHLQRYTSNLLKFSKETAE